VQRYTLLKYREDENSDAAYSVNTSDDLEENGLFRSQWQGVSSEDKDGTTVFRIDPELAHMEQTPDLKVADTGDMAIELTTREPKVFFATDKVLGDSNEILSGIGSRTVLTGAGGSITVGGRQLNRIKPIARENQAVDFQNLSDLCNNACKDVARTSQRIMRAQCSSRTAHPSRCRWRGTPS